MMKTNKTVTEIIDSDYMEYAMYTLEQRAIPSVVDGQKIVNRKILYAMINKFGGKKTKLNDLGSISNLNYHHGEVSAISAAVGMTQDWNNNSPLFIGHGAFGSRMIQEAAAPRYIYASLSDVYKKVFIDTEVCPPSSDEESPEPAHFLPIIPWVLVNGILGMSVGFKCSILPRSLSTIITATKAYLSNPERFLAADNPLPPTFPSFRGKTFAKGISQWVTQGVVKSAPKNTYEITELPIGYDREGYVTLLNELVDSDSIKDYEDNCSKDGFGFTIKVTSAQKDAVDNDPIKFFKLEKTHTEILTTIGIDGKLKIFQSVAELIAYFCEYRTKKFGDKLEFDKTKIREHASMLSDKLRFIQDVIDEKLPLKDTTKAEMIDHIFENITKADYGKTFIRIPLYECTPEEVAKLRSEIEGQRALLVELNSQTPEKIFSQRLNGIKV